MMKIHTLPMGPVQANCYVVIDEHSGEAAVIDPGDYTDELKSVLRDLSLIHISEPTRP